MTRVNTRILVPLVTGALGVLWLVVGAVDHGLWIDGRPTGGFFPGVAGVLLAVVSALAISGELKAEPPSFIRTHLYPTIAAVSVVLAAMLIGFFPAMTVYVFLWMRLFERYSLRFSVLVTVLTIAAVYGIFSMWLRVPFPGGLVMQWIVG